MHTSIIQPLPYAGIIRVRYKGYALSNIVTDRCTPASFYSCKLSEFDGEIKEIIPLLRVAVSLALSVASWQGYLRTSS